MKKAENENGDLKRENEDLKRQVSILSGRVTLNSESVQENTNERITFETNHNEAKETFKEVARNRVITIT